MKKIGFLSFGHWSTVAVLAGAIRRRTPSSSRSSWPRRPRSSAPTARTSGSTTSPSSSASPFPLLAAIGARTKRIEIGTAVIDMRYENPLYMAEDAGAADLIAGGRLQLGISRGSPEQVIDGFRYFGYQPAEDDPDADMARQHAEVFLQVLDGEGFAEPNPRRCSRTRRACSASSRTRPACATGSGGAPARARPPSGRPSRA